MWECFERDREWDSEKESAWDKERDKELVNQEVRIFLGVCVWDRQRQRDRVWKKDEELF